MPFGAIRNRGHKVLYSGTSVHNAPIQVGLKAHINLQNAGPKVPWRYLPGHHKSIISTTLCNVLQTQSEKSPHGDCEEKMEDIMYSLKCPVASQTWPLKMP